MRAFFRHLRIPVWLACGVAALVIGCFEIPPPPVQVAPSADTSGDGGSADTQGGCSEACPTYCREDRCAQVERLIGAYFHSCAQLSDGTTWCWGRQSEGGFGVQSGSEASAPVMMPVPAGAPVAAGNYHTCWIEGMRTVACVGWNPLGQVGGPDLEATYLEPHRITFEQDLTQIAAAGEVTCVLPADGRPLCWGREMDGQSWMGGVTNGHGSPTPRELPGLAPGERVLQIAPAGYSVCVRLADSVRCIGHGEEGVLGTGDTDDRTSLSPVVGLGAVESLWAGVHHVCALSDEGARIRCWGQNYWGQAGGLPGSPNTLEPADLSDWFDQPIVAVHAGWRTTCVLDALNRLLCWGLNEGGVLGAHGPGLVLEPTEVAGIRPLRVAWAGSHGSAATADSVVGWGANEHGQVGTGFAGPPVIPNPTALRFELPDPFVGAQSGGMK